MVKLVIWLEIVPTAKLANPGATTIVSATAVRQLVSALLQRTSSTPSWPRWEVRADSLARRSSTTATVPLVETATVEASAPSSLGSVVLPEVLHPGRVTTATIVVVVTAALLLHLGLAAAAVAVSLMNKATVLATVRLHGLLLLLVLLRLVPVMATVATATTRTLVWVLPAHTVLLAMAHLHLPPVLLLVLVLSSRPMALLAVPRRLHHRRPDLCLLHLLLAMPLLLPRQAMFPHHRPHLRLRWTNGAAVA